MRLDQQIPTRVRWDGTSCVARHDHVEVVVPFRPPVFSHSVAELDYAPSCRTQQVRESAQCWRDMTADEASLLHAWLVLLVQDVRAFAGRLTKD